jgi:hypothetical protein
MGRADHLISELKDPERRFGVASALNEIKDPRGRTADRPS